MMKKNYKQISTTFDFEKKNLLLDYEKKTIVQRLIAQGYYIIPFYTRAHTTFGLTIFQTEIQSRIVFRYRIRICHIFQIFFIAYEYILVYVAPNTI